MSHDKNTPVDFVEEDESEETFDQEGNFVEPEEEADFTGASDELGFAPDR